MRPGGRRFGSSYHSPGLRLQLGIHTVMASSSLASRLEEAARLKEQGNEKFKAGDYKGAIVLYKRVFLYTKGVEGYACAIRSTSCQLTRSTDARGMPTLTLTLTLSCAAFRRDQSMQQYAQALNREAPTPEQVDAARVLVGAVSGNLAAAYMHTKELDRVVVYAQKVR